MSARRKKNQKAAAIRHDEKSRHQAKTEQTLKEELFGQDPEEIPEEEMIDEEDADTPGWTRESRVGEKVEDQPQKFIKNDRYFTICIYAFILVVASTIAIRAIVFPGQTRDFIGGVLRAVGPFLIAILIAYILQPFVKAVYKVLRKCIKILPERPAMVIAMLIVYLIAFGLLITLLVYILPELVRNLGDLVTYVPTGFEELRRIMGVLQEHFPDVDFSSITTMLDNTQSNLISSLREIAGELIPVIYSASVSLVTMIGNFLIAVIVSVYMLYGRGSLLRLLKILMYTIVREEKIPVFLEICKDCNRIFSSFVVSKMVDSVIIGILCSILMTILKLPYVMLISVIVGITNMIPYFGPFIGAVPGLAIMLVIDPVKALVFGIMILCLQQFDGLVLGPKLLGDSTGMKPIWIIFAITIGGKFFGVVGMFMGVPVCAILAYLGERYAQNRLLRKNIDIEEL